MNTESVFKYPVPIIEELAGVVTVPTGFDPAKESLPVIVFLHGAGERGDNLNLVKVHGIPKLFSRDPDYHGLRVITLSPQVPNDTFVWNQLTPQLLMWIKAAVKEFNGDEDRVSVTGLSMGGFGTWDIITTYPEYFSCAAPVCGGGLSWRANLPKMPIRAYHSVDDNVVPYSYSKLMVFAARASGADVELITYDKLGHNSWDMAYEHTDLVEWLVSNRKSART